jgi:membrane-associated phospholipid phosphatase
MSIWTVAFAAWWLFLGLPLTDPILTFGWLWAATIAWRIDRPRRVHLRFARDWVAVVVLLQVYNLSRGLADQGVVPHALELIVADQGMFGWLTDGRVPTLWLQEHLFDPDDIHWWDVFASWVYFSHFVVTPAVAVVLWLRDRARWLAFVLRWIMLSAAGLVTYFLYPAAPPWWAARYGLIDPVERGSTRAWDAVGLHGAGNLINAGQYSSNPVAAMPSLHTAFALLVVVFFLPRVRRRWWPLLLAYPLAMTFTLVYSGEHYMIDVFMGWLYVGLVCVAATLFERRWGPYSRARAERPAVESAAADLVLAAGSGAAERAEAADRGAASDATGRLLRAGDQSREESL